MILTLQKLINATFQDIGVLAQSESPTNDAAQDALTKLNMFIDACSVRSLMILAAIMEDFVLTAGLQEYLIGLGQTAPNFNTSQPSKITDAFLRNSEGEDTDIDILLIEEWMGLPTKSIDTGPPVAIYYDPGLTQQATPAGTIWTYPIPDDADTYTLFLGEQKPLNEFVGLTDVVTFQPAYYEFLEYSLAKRLWPQYHQDGTPFRADLEDLRKEAERVVMTMNTKAITSEIEVPGRRGTYGNILDFGWGNVGR